MKTTAEFIKKWNVSYKNIEQANRFSKEMFEDLELLKKEFASLKEDKWISVETPPEKAGSFIVSINGKSKEAFFSFGFKRWYVKSTAPLEVEDMEINPTHWQPLPSPPKTEK